MFTVFECDSFITHPDPVAGIHTPELIQLHMDGKIKSICCWSENACMVAIASDIHFVLKLQIFAEMSPHSSTYVYKLPPNSMRRRTQ